MSSEKSSDSDENKGGASTGNSKLMVDKTVPGTISASNMPIYSPPRNTMQKYTHVVRTEDYEALMTQSPSRHNRSSGHGNAKQRKSANVDPQRSASPTGARLRSVTAGRSPSQDTNHLVRSSRNRSPVPMRKSMSPTVAAAEAGQSPSHHAHQRHSRHPCASMDEPAPGVPDGFGMLPWLDPTLRNLTETSVSTIKPRWLDELEKKVEFELRRLEAPACGPSSVRLGVFRSCFDTIIDNMKVFRPLLAKVKLEYDLVVSHGEGELNSLGQLREQIVNFDNRTLALMSRIIEEYSRKLANIHAAKSAAEADAKRKGERIAELELALENKEKERVKWFRACERTDKHLRLSTLESESMVNQVRELNQTKSKNMTLMAKMDVIETTLGEIRLENENYRVTNINLQGLSSQWDDAMSKLADYKKKVSRLKVELESKRNETFELKRALAKETLRVTSHIKKQFPDVFVSQVKPRKPMSIQLMNTVVPDETPMTPLRVIANTTSSGAMTPAMTGRATRGLTFDNDVRNDGSDTDSLSAHGDALSPNRALDGPMSPHCPLPPSQYGDAGVSGGGGTGLRKLRLLAPAAIKQMLINEAEELGKRAEADLEHIVQSLAVHIDSMQVEINKTLATPVSMHVVTPATPLPGSSQTPGGDGGASGQGHSGGVSTLASPLQQGRAQAHSHQLEEEAYGPPFFVSEGKGDDVPLYLQAPPGRVNNLKLPKRVSENTIRQIWSAKAAAGEDGMVPLSDFVYYYFKKKYVSDRSAVEWGYSLRWSLKQFQDDADFDIFKSILEGSLHEEVYQQQCEHVEEVIQLARESVKAGGKPDVGQKLIFFDLLAKRFSEVKDANAMTELKNALTADQGRGMTFSISDLFAEDCDLNQGEFAEAIRDQFLEQRLAYLQDIETEMQKRWADAEYSGADLPAPVVLEALAAADPGKSSHELLQMMSWGLGTEVADVGALQQLSVSKLSDFIGGLKTHGLVRVSRSSAQQSMAAMITEPPRKEKKRKDKKGKRK